MFTAVRLALVLSCSECDFWKNWTDSFRLCFITVAEVEMHPYTPARSRGLSTAKARLAVIVNRLFMKLFRTSDISVIKYCQEMFHFELPSITLQRSLEKFEVNIAMLRLFQLNLFLVKILGYVYACARVCIVYAFMLCIYA